MRGCDSLFYDKPVADEVEMHLLLSGPKADRDRSTKYGETCIVPSAEICIESYSLVIIALKYSKMTDGETASMFDISFYATVIALEQLKPVKYASGCSS
jgi:hypothetical protein